MSNIPIVCNIHKAMYCIYNIVNQNNGKLYVGKTNYSTFRLQIHMNQLKNNKHPNKKLQKDFNNGDFFEINLIKKLPNDTINEIALILENFYIDKYDTINKGYNKRKNQAKLSKNSVENFCKLLDCQVGDILQYVEDSKKETLPDKMDDIKEND